MKIICHKISSLYPNSIFGLIDNLNKGYKSFNIDVNTCKNELILYNDNYFNGEHIQNLMKNDFLYNGKYCVNTFLELMSVFNNYNNINLFFNLKGIDPNIVDYICLIYNKFNQNNNYYFQSSNFKFIKKFKKNNNTIICGLKIQGYIPISYKMLKYIDFFCIEEDFYTHYVNYGKDIYLYGINNKKYYDSFIIENIKGIVTDYPELFN
jgi:hypothetical protein